MIINTLYVVCSMLGGHTHTHTHTHTYIYIYIYIYIYGFEEEGGREVKDEQHSERYNNLFELTWYIQWAERMCSTQ